VGVGERLRDVRERVAQASRAAGRSPDDVTLLAVTKFQPPDRIQEAADAGHLDFAENYAQDLRDKALALPGVRWHAIGPLQRNKAKYVAKAAYAFHALDRREIAVELGARREGEPLRCYLEVNVGGEATKAGVRPDEVAALYDAVRGIAGITVVGVMGMPPPDDDPAPHFLRLAELARGLDLPRLSMGTTDDFEVAIACGATDVRVGRAIFGDRVDR
jgi:PLP dependent protein